MYLYSLIEFLCLNKQFLNYGFFPILFFFIFTFVIWHVWKKWLVVFVIPPLSLRFFFQSWTHTPCKHNLDPFHELMDRTILLCSFFFVCSRYCSSHLIAIMMMIIILIIIIIIIYFPPSLDMSAFMLLFFQSLSPSLVSNNFIHLEYMLLLL